MCRRKVDHDGMLSVYERIGKERDLTPEELDRVELLIERKRRCEITKRYREKNKGLIKERRQKDLRNPRKRKRINTTNRKSRQKCRHKHIEKSKEWRANNPEKVQAYNKVRRERYHQKKQDASPATV